MGKKQKRKSSSAFRSIVKSTNEKSNSTERNQRRDRQNEERLQRAADERWLQKRLGR